MLIKNLSVIFLVLTATVINSQSIPEQLQKHVYTLASDSLNGRSFGSPDGIKAADYIINEFINIGIEPFVPEYKHQFTKSYFPITIYGNNIIGIIKGNHPELQNEYIVFGAHYDHLGFTTNNNSKTIYNGADDNASGVATIIEMARILSNNKQNIKRSIILIAFDGEESGLIGSSILVEQNILDNSKIKAMFSIDMVGMYMANNGLNLKGSANIENGNQIFSSLAKTNNINLTELGYQIETNTDTWPFAKANIPAIAVNTGLKSPYHKPEDDANLLDYQGMAKITAYMANIAQYLANADSCQHSTRFKKQINKREPPFLTVSPFFVLGTNRCQYYNINLVSKTMPKIGVGLLTRLRISKNLAFQPEIYYNYYFGIYPDGKSATQSVTIPITISYKLIKADNWNTGIFINAGWVYNYIIDTKIENRTVDFLNDFNRELHGVTAGLSFDTKKFFIAFNSELFITESAMPKTETKYNFTTRNSYLKVGYKF